MSAAPTRAPLDCPRCGKPVAGDQDWCLNCGQAARTRLVGAPHWRRPVAVLAALMALSLAALAVAFVSLTDEPAPPKLVPIPTVTNIPAPVPVPAPAPTPTTTTETAK